MARTIAAFFLMCVVAVISGTLTVGLLRFTADAMMQAGTPRVAAETFEPKRGYIARLPLAKAEDLNILKTVPVVPVAAKSDAPLPETPAPTFVVVVDSLRVRSGPTKTSRQVFGLNSGTKVTVSRAEQGWFLVIAEGGRTGWAYGKYLRPTLSEQLEAKLE